MFSQLLHLAGAQAPTLLVLIELTSASISGGSVPRVWMRQRRRALRRAARNGRRPLWHPRERPAAGNPA